MLDFTGEDIMSYDNGLTEKEKYYIEKAAEVGAKFGNCKELSDLCKSAYRDYRTGAISVAAYNKVYATCMDYAYPR